MRIAIVSPFPPPYGGMAVQAEKLVRLLKEDGVDAIAVRTNPEFPGFIRPLARVPIVRTVVSTLLFLWALRKTLSRVHALYFLTAFFDFFFWVTYPGLVLIKAHRKRVVLSARGGGAKKFFEKYRMVVRPILRNVDGITTPSGFLQKVFRDELGIETSVVPNIADLSQFKFRRRTHFRPQVIVTRTLEKIYDVGCVIRAFQIIHERSADARLGIVGDGKERANLERLVRELRLVSCVTFYGGVRHEEIQSCYDDHDIFANASTVDNVPGVILEAFASGLPVVSTNPGGIPYMVEDGVTGLLVDVGDHEALARKILRVIEEPELGTRLAANARKECERYRWENIRNILVPVLIG